MAESDTPIKCTLSPNSMVDRLGEFETLFARGLARLEREPLLLRLTFEADAARQAQIRELLARERHCCAFLTFTVEETGTGLLVSILAPAEAGPTLDGFQKLAERNAPPQVAVEGWTG